MNNIVPFPGQRLLINPQMDRVATINHRLNVAQTLSKSQETSYMGKALVEGIRHDIITLKPHHLKSDGVPFISANFEPVQVAKSWRGNINAQLTLIKAFEKLQEIEK